MERNDFYCIDDHNNTHHQSPPGSRHSSSSKQWGRNQSSTFNRSNLDKPLRSPNQFQKNVSRSNFDKNFTSENGLKNERTIYAINLQLEPVKWGIVGGDNQRKQEFKGLGAFNHYFGLLYPTDGFGYTIPDIWDGYFHITLSNFHTQMSPVELEKTFEKFKPSLNGLSYIPDISFQTSCIEEHSGQNRVPDRNEIDFMTLKIDTTPDIELFYEKIQPLLDEIKTTAKCKNDWKPVSLNNLHVTIRKYDNIKHNIDERFKMPKNIPIQEFPLKFQCSRLEIKQTRRQAVDRHKNSNGKYRWWNGVTEIDGRCSGCQTPISIKGWPGFCYKCGQYESIKPIWSTDGRVVFND